ncbi:hypothetical protein DAEQUDRAFT_729279 [Daedalea quercina L-15889]|uniref:C2H2-type domain-containing protein n=1 Tax=Daedalea quercina L-15889 TaxID=1314783 RepID=A0A165NQE6_9APHY|nr:hypothetical protein DAEQUDRAFT_729279 [Daedalea quercina L-15889]
MAHSIEATHGSPRSPESFHSNQLVVPPLPRSPRIPLDIMYNIIENILFDHDRLPIALVCRDWYECFTAYCPPDLSIYSRRSLNSLLAQCKQGNEYARQRLERTTSLRIYQRDDDDDRYCAAVPLVLAPRMPAVRTLIFFGSIRPPVHPTFTRSLRQFSDLRGLEISRFTVFSFAELRDMILSFPQLNSLILRGGKCIQPNTPAIHNSNIFPTMRAPRVRCPQLQQAELRHLDFGLLSPLLDWLASSYPKLVPAVFKNDEVHAICEWDGCWEQFARTQDAIMDHIITVHFKSASKGHTGKIRCQWEGCSRRGYMDLNSVLLHVMDTHAPMTSEVCHYDEPPCGEVIMEPSMRNVRDHFDSSHTGASLAVQGVRINCRWRYPDSGRTCGESLPNAQLIKHVFNSHIRKIHRCRYCRVYYARRDSLVRHMSYCRNNAQE